ncbi:MAG: UDP-N-acetylmuramoyl-L-alanyl-D-glutamate--2,6-diaminopimelate ligase [Chlamydiae bacterium]|nr:UDP-N-acetylmuramoyl-L-alanyl-D-glutamate--2,6-diaminopimelate ligase [Chlamydiota bacterium]
MRLKRLLKNLEGIDVKGSKEIEITGLSSNSKTVAPGNLFIAKKGLSSDGSEFIQEAIDAGASAILTDMYNPFLKKDVVQLITKSVKPLESKIADLFFEEPSKELFAVGVTGTSGKTTTSYMIRHMLQKLLGPVGLIGTVEWIIGRQHLPSTMTTPDVITNHKLLREMLEQGCRAAVMEVSSHALTQGRVDHIDFDIAVFTNLSQDHLDYHKDMQEYAEAKALVFSSLKTPSKWAVVNADSPWSSIMIQNTRGSIFRYGIENSADLSASKIELSEAGMKFTVIYKGESLPFFSRVIGRFNVYNFLAAMSVGLLKGYPLKKVIASLSSFTEVPGRLQQVINPKGLHIFVDYSHKPDALENVLMTLSELKKGNLICLFGCGGDRDRGKRPLMGSIAERLSDVVVITSDNPRSEDPLSIIQEILQGIKEPSSILIEPDRRLAIEKAIGRMKPEDILLIAGKGHETYQVTAQGKIDFDDRLIAQGYCN